jgi:hypothetical protein
LSVFRDTDTLLGGYFGALGRRSGRNRPPIELVAEQYTTVQDIDIGFLNASRLADGAPRLTDFVKLLGELGLDIAVLAGCTPAAAREVARRLGDFGMEFGSSAAPAGIEPHASAIWNKRSIAPLPAAWPDALVGNFRAVGGTPGLETIQGLLFDHIPGLFRFRLVAAPKGTPPFDIVSFWLDRDDVGSARRQIAARVLGAVLAQTLAPDAKLSLTIGGRFDADVLASELPPRLGADTAGISVEDDSGGSLSVFKRGGSPVDRVWIPPELHIKNGATELAALAPARPPIGSLPGHPDFRPLLARLSFFAQEPVAAEGGALDPQLLGNLQPP